MRDTSAIYKIDQVEREDHLDARRQGERLQARQGRRPLLLPARRPDASRRPDQHVRRPGRAAASSRRPRAASSCSSTTRSGARSSSASTTARPTPRPRARAACRRSTTATSSSAGAHSRSSASSPSPRQAALRRQPARGRRLLPRLPRAVAGDADHAAGRGGGADRRLAPRRLRELERRHRGRVLGGPRRCLGGFARARRVGAARRLRDADRGRRLGRRWSVAVRALDATGTELATSSRSAPSASSYR